MAHAALVTVNDAYLGLTRLGLGQFDELRPSFAGGSEPCPDGLRVDPIEFMTWDFTTNETIKRLDETTKNWVFFHI